MTDQPRMVKLTELWERTSQKGTRYFSGFLSDAQVLMFEAGPHPEYEGVTVWRLFVQERDPARRPQARAEAPDARSTRPAPSRAPTAPGRARRAIPAAAGADAGDDDGVPFDDPLPFG